MGKLLRLTQNILNGHYDVKGKTYDEFSEPTSLVYDTDTCIVYYKFLEKVYVQTQTEGEITARSGFMCPYLGPNGKTCKFVDGKIMEVG